MASEAMSRLLGAADNVYSFVPKPSSLRFFSHGWGDLGKARASRHKMGECIEGREYERAAARIPLPAGAGDGSFPSPWAEYLPAESADVPFRSRQTARRLARSSSSARARATRRSRTASTCLRSRSSTLRASACSC